MELQVDAVHAAQALDQVALAFISIHHARSVGFFAGFAGRQGICGRADRTGKTDGGAEDKDGFFYIDHFYPIPKKFKR